MKSRLLRQCINFSKTLSLNNYILFVFLLLLAFCSIASVISNIVTGFPMTANIKWGLAFCFCVFGFYLLLKQIFLEIYKSAVFLTMLFIVAIPSWFYGGGDNTITLLYLLVITAELFLIFENNIIKWILAALCIVSSCVLLVLTYHFPELIQHTQGQNVFVDSLIQVAIVFTIVTTSISIYTRRYRQQHVLLTKLNKQLEEQASIDSLSQIYNKRKILEILSQIPNDQTIHSLHMAMIDIDSFKFINDTYGHPTGDSAIFHIASHFSQIMGDRGYTGRYGGDEFVLLISNQTDDAIAKLADKLLKIPPLGELTFTISGGIVKCPCNPNLNGPDCSNLDVYNLIDQADQLLLKAKRDGKNHIILWHNAV